MKSHGCCKVNKFSGYGNRIPEEAGEGCFFRGTKDPGSGGTSVEQGRKWRPWRRLVPLSLVGENAY